MNQAAINNCRHGLRGIVSVAWTWAWPRICHTPNSGPTSPRFNPDEKSQGMKKALLLGGEGWIESGGRDGCRAWQVKVWHRLRLTCHPARTDSVNGQVATLVKKQQKYPTLKIDFPVNFHSNCINFCMKISQLLKNEEMKRHLKGADMPRAAKRQKCEGGVCHRQD